MADKFAYNPLNGNFDLVDTTGGGSPSEGSVYPAVDVATTANLTATYDNGVSGVGATLTNSGAQAALTIDGVALATTSIVLVKNQADPTQNGIYFVQDAGSGLSNWVLTRSLLYDQPSEVIQGQLFPILNGTVNSGSLWVQDNVVTAIGTDNIAYSLFSTSGGGGVNSVSGVTNRTTISGTASDPIVDIASTYSGQNTLVTLGVVTTGTWQGSTIGSTFGGTGLSAYAVGDIIFASAINTLAVLAAGSNTNVLTLVGGIPSWQAPAVATVGTITGDSGGALGQTSNNWNLFGAHGINSSGAGSTLTFAINNFITLGDLSAIAPGSPALTCTSGDIDVVAGNLELPGTASANVGVIKFLNERVVHSYGIQNDFFGRLAGNFTLTGTGNTGVGQEALKSLTSGLRNIGIGNNCLETLQTGNDNTSIGSESHRLTSGGSSNTSVGSYTLEDSTSDANCAFGTATLSNLTSGSHNSCFGTNSASNLLTGQRNICIGWETGSAYTSSESHNILIANAGIIAENNTLRIGTTGSGTAQQNRAFLAAVAGVTVAASAPIGIDANEQLSSFGYGAAGEVFTSNGLGNSPTWQPAGGGMAWSNVSGTSQAAAVNSGYVANNGSAVTITLPATFAIGDRVAVVGNGAGGWIVTAATGDTIRLMSTVSATGGSATSNTRYDCAEFIGVTADSEWLIRTVTGSPNIA